MNFEQHVADQLAHLIRMAKEPGWKAWAWHRAKAMARDCPELYAGLPAALTAAMRSASSFPALLLEKAVPASAALEALPGSIHPKKPSAMRGS
jgi:hypothetical protein